MYILYVNHLNLLAPLYIHIFMNEGISVSCDKDIQTNQTQRRKNIHQFADISGCFFKEVGISSFCA